MKFQDKMHHIYWQDTLSHFRSERVLSDITLVADGLEFPAHKLVLSIFSPYFRVMFSAHPPFIESKQEKVTLTEVDSNALKEILNYMYTSSIDINEDNIFELIDIINLMQIHTLRSFVNFYLEKSLTLENCLVLYDIANLYQYLDFASKAFNFIVTNFSSLVLSEEFLHISFDTLYKIVSSRLLEIHSEDELVKYFVLRWIKYEEKRKDYAELLFSKIDLEELSASLLKELKNNPLVPCSIQKEILKIENSCSQKQGNTQVFERDKLHFCKTNRHKKQRTVVFAFGGETGGKATESVECFTAGYGNWRNVVPECVTNKNSLEHVKYVPPLKSGRYYAASASDGCENIYVIGGQNDESLLNECEVYDIRTNQWDYFKDYPLKLYATGAAYTDNKLYVAGGSGVLGTIKMAYTLDLRAQVWKPIRPLNKARYFHSLVAVGGFVYAIGGFGFDGRPLRCCERYDPGSNKWFEVAELKQGRAKFGCVAVDEYIYVIGGTTMECDCLKTVEKYNTLNNEWLPETSMTLPRHSFSAVLCDREIFCIGGSNCIYDLDSVDKFSLRTKRWHWEQSLQFVRLGPCSASLKVPYF